jgi:hypothetical protein
MGTVIEAIIYSACKQQIGDRIALVNNYIEKIKTSIVLKNYQLGNSTGIVVSLDTYRIFDDIFFDIAQELSALIHKSILIRYDDRVGLRYSCLYENGSSVKEFLPEHEIFVRVDESGETLSEKTFTFQQVESDDNQENEYETIYNSIELGLTELSIDLKWKDIFQSILEQK